MFLNIIVTSSMNSIHPTIADACKEIELYHKQSAYSHQHQMVY